MGYLGMKHLFIINPTAGNGKALRYKSIIEDYFKDKNEKYDIEITERPGHAIEIVSNYDYSEECRVYSIGGDGTLNEVINGLIDKNASLGIIPAGSGNDFVRSYLEDDNFKDILKRTIEGKSKDIDIGCINNKYFINISAVGFPADVNKNAKAFKKKRIIPGPLAYIFGAIVSLFKFKYPKIKFIIDGIELDEEMFLVALANGKYYGGGIILAPDAEISDGELEFYGVKKSNPYKIFKYLMAFLFGKDIRSIKETYYYKCKSLKIISEKEIISNIDGEIIESNEFDFDIVPKGIKLIIPNEEIGMEEEYEGV